MDIIEIMKTRTSRRSYNNSPLTEEQTVIINDIINELMQKYDVYIKLLVDNKDVFKGFISSYGMFSGVNNYIVFKGKIDDINLNEKVGIVGEQIILKATEIGLGTCWVGGTYNKKSCPIQVNYDEKIVCIITIGEVKDQLTFKEKLIKKVAKRSTKKIEDMISSDVNLPNWVYSGMKAVQLAPSALNRQSVKFTYKDGLLRAYVENINSYQGIDLGIAKLHFSLGSKVGTFQIGNNAEFIYENKLEE